MDLYLSWYSVLQFRTAVQELWSGYKLVEPSVLWEGSWGISVITWLSYIQTRRSSAGPTFVSSSYFMWRRFERN